MGEEVWLEDEAETTGWTGSAKGFATGVHLTTLFSLISLGHTPNFERFWAEVRPSIPLGMFQC